MSASRAVLWDMDGTLIDSEEFHWISWRDTHAKEELYRQLLRRDGISPLPGVAHWVHRLHKEGWLQTIASAAPRANIEAVLEALSATHIFHGIVSAEDVHRGKPD